MLRRSKRKSSSAYSGTNTGGTKKKPATEVQPPENTRQTSQSDATRQRNFNNPMPMVTHIQGFPVTPVDGGAPSSIPPYVPTASSGLSSNIEGTVQNNEIALQYPPCIDITPVTSIHSNIGSHVSIANKNKILNGEYIDLAQLLDNNKVETQEKQIVLINGMLQTKENSKHTINTIEKWTDAFLVFSSIYLGAHIEKYQGVLKYIQVLRLGANRVQGMGWKTYDEQFRYKMSIDPSKDWGNIDQELWLLYMVDTPKTYQNAGQYRSNAGAFSNIIPQKCYGFNYKGMCDRVNCSYAHTCIRCSGAHPLITCSLNNVRNQPFRPSLANNFQVAVPVRHSPFRARFQSRYTFRPQGNRMPVQSRYLGPRQFSNQH